MTSDTKHLSDGAASYSTGGDARDVPQSFKRTDLGVIPDDWQVKRLGELGQIVRGASPRPAGDPRFFNGSFIPWLTVAALTNLPEHELHVSETVGGLTEEGAKRSRTLVPGTLIIANSGATLGVAKILDLNCCANDGIAAVINHRLGDKPFLCYWVNTQTDRLRNVVATGNGQPNLNTTLISEIRVPFPRAAEQRAIAEALSDVDGLLGALEALIVKKRAIKQAAMQQLLTGKTRLPGFGGQWVELNMASDSILKARIGWQGLTTTEYLSTGEYYLVTGTDIVNGRVDWTTCHFVNRDRFVQDRNIQLKPGDVLLTKDGTIGKAAYVDMPPGPATLNSGVFVIRPKNDAYIPTYMYYVLTSRIFDEFLARLQAGSTITHLYQKDFAGFAFHAPPHGEQTAIAAVLSDMDAEIAGLKARRDKTRAIKQGMIQELLTGRVRLVEPKVAA